MSNYRNRKLLDLAHHLTECQIGVPGVCIGHQMHGCEPVHSDSSRHGKGAGIKASDLFHAAGCHACHEALPKLPREGREWQWQRGFERTMLEYFRRGWVGVMK